MKTLFHVGGLFSVTLTALLLVAGCDGPPVAVAPAPPGPTELGPAVGLSAPPEGAAVFDLKYRAETGAAGDVRYFSFWGYGGSDDEAKQDPFLQEVRKKVSNPRAVQNPNFKGRKWSAVEYQGRKARALYFDLNANGKLEENERLLPTRASGETVEFITPDFAQDPTNGANLCRALLQVNFYGGSEPNCMWSPASLLEGSAPVGGKAMRLLLFANQPGGEYDKFGSSTYSLMPGDSKLEGEQYVPRETLSSLLANDGTFYHLKLEGRRTNGLPARALLIKDDSPTGELVARLVGSNSFQAAITTASLNGTDDNTVFFRIDGSKGNVKLPAGNYSVNSGAATYGGADGHDWEASFSQGPRAEVKPGEVTTVTLGEPVLAIRAIKEEDRYNSKAQELAVFKQGIRVYLEPKITGKRGEVLSRFRQPNGSQPQKADRPPRVTITDAYGKELLSSKMEYG